MKLFIKPFRSSDPCLSSNERVRCTPVQAEYDESRSTRFHQRTCSLCPWMLWKSSLSPEDATRTDKAFLLEAVQTAIDAGATIINVPDTVGFTNPTEYGALLPIWSPISRVSSRSFFLSHCHDDLGMATANALAAIENGADRVEGTINGIGERAGNTALEEVALALHIRNDLLRLPQHQVKRNKTHQRSGGTFVWDRYRKQSDRRRNVPYAHESGIHQDACLENPETYEIITPATGRRTNHTASWQTSGRHAFVDNAAAGTSLTKKKPMNCLNASKSWQIRSASDRTRFVSVMLIRAAAKKMAASWTPFSCNTCPMAIKERWFLSSKTRKTSGISYRCRQYPSYLQLDRSDFPAKPKLLNYEITALTSGRCASGSARGYWMPGNQWKSAGSA